MERLNGTELAKATADAINASFSFEGKDFCKQMHNEHRTLQQNFMRLIFQYIESTAETEYFDERNEASVEAAKVLKKAIEDNHLYLPYI